MPKTFTFTKGNAKVGKDTLTFSLPSGHSCPFAHLCLTKADKNTGHITDGPQQEFRCFSASAEAAFPSVRKARWKNWELVQKHLKNGNLAQKLSADIPEKTKFVRIHVAGDFFSQDYFDAWLEVARLRPKTIFYAYTKSLPFWKKRLSTIPHNLRLTASLGGKKDKLAGQLLLPTAQVVLHPKQAKLAKLEIDHDDSLAKTPIRRPFALLIHGTQPKGSEAASAISQLKRQKITFSYSKAA
jgi:hypothetical protein